MFNKVIKYQFDRSKGENIGVKIISLYENDEFSWICVYLKSLMFPYLLKDIFLDKAESKLQIHEYSHILLQNYCNTVCW
jgi:hypothetical protein